MPGSGAGYRKGDVWAGKWMIECKTTTRAHYTLSVNTLDKLAKQSLEADRSAALIIVFHQGYRQNRHAVLVLTQRGEFQPDWRSRRVTEAELIDNRFVSRYGIWEGVSLESFQAMLD